MRQLGKYEGRWLEVIPEPPQGNRFFSIIDFTFNQKTLKYQLNGINFYTGFKTGISFEAHKFIERTFKNGFYYITNPTSEHKNGLGKIAFIKPGQDNLTRAEGYFFDSGNGNCSTKYNVILIKCDKKLVKRLNLDYTYKQIEKADSQKVMELLATFANEQKENYLQMIEKQP